MPKGTNLKDWLKCGGCIYFDERREADERCRHPFGFACKYFNEMIADEKIEKIADKYEK